MGSQLPSSLNNMTTWTILLLACLAGSISAAPGPSCEDCKKYAGVIHEMLTTEEAIDEQADTMAAILCAMDKQPEKCDNQTREEWPILADILFTEFIQPDVVCVDMGMCYERQGQQPMAPKLPAQLQLSAQSQLSSGSCQYCNGELYSFAGYLLDTRERDRWLEYLQNENYCAANSTDPDCEETLPVRLYMYLLVLAESLFVRARDICCEIEESCCV